MLTLWTYLLSLRIFAKCAVAVPNADGCRLPEVAFLSTPTESHEVYDLGV